MNLTPTYDIGTDVNHICENELKGKVIDWKYYRRENYFEYLVAFGPFTKMWMAENELKKAEE